jgi:hypothetical protein
MIIEWHIKRAQTKCNVLTKAVEIVHCQRAELCSTGSSRHRRVIPMLIDSSRKIIFGGLVAREGGIIHGGGKEIKDWRSKKQQSFERLIR